MCRLQFLTIRLVSLFPGQLAVSFNGLVMGYITSDRRVVVFVFVSVKQRFINATWKEAVVALDDIPALYRRD